MEYRKLGKSELEISVVGLGCLSYSSEWGGTPQRDEDSISTVQRAVELGVNFIDTAAQYGYGHSEDVVGKAFAEKNLRDKVILATKCGMRWKREGAFSSPSTGFVGDVTFFYRDSSRKGIFEEIEGSLKRLQTDYIDLYQIHWPDPETPIEETALALGKLYKDGKIKAVGVSNYSVSQMEEFMKHCPLHSLQPPYSMVCRDIEKDILPFCRENTISVVVYSPLQQGLLTGKYFLGEKIPEARRDNPEYKGERFKINKRMVEGLKGIADRYNKTLTQLTINWTISQPGITAAIVGARKISQIENNVGGSGWVMSGEDMELIDSILEERNKEIDKL